MSDDLKRDLDALHTEVSALRRLFESRLTSDDAKEKAFDELYAELRQYKDDFVHQAERPLLLDLLLFYDSLTWFQQSLGNQEMSPDVAADSFQYLLDEFLELLYRRDVLPMDESTTFDRRVHKAVKVEVTDDATRDHRIAQVLKRGFVRGERLLRAEEVVILRLRGAKDSEEG
jgi:molecular chaperone GrpE (heat shock protein)